MREKRVSLVVLTCSVLVATCASVSYSVVTSSYFHKYVAVVGSTIPILFSGQINPVSPATVWIPEDDAVDTDGSVQDEFAEVAHVFARPDNRIIRPKDEEDEITQLPVPWTSLKNEWKIYQKVQHSRRKTPEEKRKKQKQKVSGGSAEEENNSSEEEEDDAEEDEEDEDEEEEDEPEGRSAVSSIVAKVLPSVAVPERKSGSPAKTTANKEGERKEIPLAFYGQQNHDDDEKDFLKDEANIFNKKRNQKKDVDVEDDDTSGSNEAASVEDYADYAQDDDDDEENDDSSENQGKKKLQFEDIPLAIREMILNDLANQNNGSGYHPNLAPQVTKSSSSDERTQAYFNKLTQHQQQQSGGSSASVENDDGSKEGNSSEEDEEDDNNAAEVVQPQPSNPLSGLPDLGALDPTPPAIRPTPSPRKKKGDDDDEADEEDEDEGGKGKGKGKGKGGKKGKGKKGKGWGWKGQLHVHHPGGWGGWKGEHHHHKDHGWGWDPEKHDGLLEQLVRGSTWERVLKYYHWKRDQQQKEDEHHYDEHAPHNVHTHSHPPHHEEHPGHELSHGIPEGWGWEPDSKIKKIVKKAFKGSFWERAVQTYAQYKENQAKNPRKPTLVDLDTEHGLKMDIEHRRR